MERQGQAGAAEPGASPAGAFQPAVQRTQVLLLGGERWEPGGAQAARGSLAPSPAPPAGQLVFFVCRAPSLRGRGRAERLREVLRGVREQSRGAPTALLAVLLQPAPEEEAEARSHLAQLLREAFPPPGPEVHTAVFRPGRPRGALELRPAAEAPREQPESGDIVVVEQGYSTCGLRPLCLWPAVQLFATSSAGLLNTWPAEDAVWISRATLFKVLGALCVACAGIIGSQYMNTSI